MTAIPIDLPLNFQSFAQNFSKKESFTAINQLDSFLFLQGFA
jgi:hypothetical protein